MFRILSGLSLIVLLAAFTSGCHKRRVAVPLAPIPAPAESTAPPAPTPGPAAAPAPPQSPQPQEKPSPLGPPTAQPSQPPQPAPSTQLPPANPPQQQPPQPPRRATPAAPAPRLGDILTSDQERQYNLAIDQSLARAENSLKAVANRKLSKEQQGVVTQVRSFMQQAQTTRKTNITAARSLAERADVLARDLAGSRR